MRKLAIIILILIVLGAAGAFWLQREMARPYRSFSAAQIFVEISRGTARWSIANLLQQNGVIHSRLAFMAVSERHRKRVLQAGEYMFNQPLTPNQVFEQIAEGRIYVHFVTIPEGWTMFDIAAELERQRLCTNEEFLSVARSPALVRDIAPQAKSLEGFLFPSTYQFSRGVSPEEIAATMVREFREEWSKLQSSARPMPVVYRPARETAQASRSAFAFPLTPVQTVTLASLVERETPQPQERPIIASVFYNRLKLGLPLQCDPTVQYALDLAGKPAPKVTAEDLRIQSPYNTYLHRGLPPGPIANPGDASLRAALNPAKTHYLYFVANNSGGHFFSRTLAEHNRNVKKYRRLLQGLPAEPPPPAHSRKKQTNRKHSAAASSSKPNRKSQRNAKSGGQS